MLASYLYAFILSLLAGLATVVGSFIIFFDKNKNNNLVVSSLSLAAGVMICVSLTDLLPNSFNLILKNNNTFLKILLISIFFTIGVIISMLIDKYLPENTKKVKNNKDLYKIGIISMVAIALHNIPEGIATFITSSNNIKLGITLSLAIALHNIPEGISISVPIYHSTNSKFKAIIYSLISGMSEVLGAIISYLFLAPFINDYIMAGLYAIIAGIMVHIGIYELIPMAYKKGSLNTVLKSFMIGVIIMLLSHLLIK